MGISNSDERVRKVRKFVLSAQADLQYLIIADMKTMKTVPLGRDLDGECKISSQKDLADDCTLFRVRFRRADGIEKDICINEGRHDDSRTLCLSPAQKLLVSIGGF
jgi:hypothetical protein